MTVASGGLASGGAHAAGRLGASARAATNAHARASADPFTAPDPGVPRARVDHFDERRAWSDLLLQVGYGPRPAGSATLRALAVRLRAELPNAHFEDVPGQPGLRNIVGELPGRLPAVVVSAHYDVSDVPGTAAGGGNGYLGANDGAGGTAVVLELARDLRRVRRPRTAPQLRFVLFDGEEPVAGVPDSQFYRYGDRGSKAYAAAHRGQVGEMILADFVGNLGLRLPRELASDPVVWSRLRAAARRVGVGAVFPATTQPAVLDDTTPFELQQVAAIDLIDFDYLCHDRPCDTPAQLSPWSLDAAGEALYQLLARPPYR